MRDIERIPPLLAKFQEAWELVPDWRFGQLVSNLLGTGRQDVFFAEEEKWSELIDAFIQANKK